MLHISSPQGAIWYVVWSVHLPPLLVLHVVSKRSMGASGPSQEPVSLRWLQPTWHAHASSWGPPGTLGTPPCAAEKSKSLGFDVVSPLLQVTQDFPCIVRVSVEHWRTWRCQEQYYTVIKQAMQHIIYKTMEGGQSIEEIKQYHKILIVSVSGPESFLLIPL